MRSNPDGWFNAPQETRQAYEEALERLNAPRSDPEASGPILGSPAYREAVRSSDAKRRGEIEAAMREGNGSRYWGDPTMRREYSDILTRQTAPPAPLYSEPEPAEPTEASA